MRMNYYLTWHLPHEQWKWTSISCVNSLVIYMIDGSELISHQVHVSIAL